MGFIVAYLGKSQLFRVVPWQTNKIFTMIYDPLCLRIVNTRRISEARETPWM